LNENVFFFLKKKYIYISTVISLLILLIKMNNFFAAKYFKIIQTFSEEELKAFDLWLRSPWCNTNKNLIKLLEKTKRYHPTFDDKKLTKEKLFKKILPKGKFSDRRMNNLLSEGYLAAERFIIFQNLTKDENLKKDLLTKEFQNRHLEDWFFRDVNNEIARLEDKEIKDWEDHLDLLRLNRRVYHHPNQNPRMQPGGKTIVKMGEQLDLVYLLEKAAIINEKNSRNRILKNENYQVLEDIKKWRIASEGIENSSIKLYIKRFEYTEENRLEKYFEIRSFFLKKVKVLNKKEQKIHLFSLLNDTAILIKKGIIEITEYLPLYKLGLETRVLIHHDKISINTYISIVVASNTQGNFSYTKNFIQSFTEKLDKNSQTDAYYYAKAHTSYYEKEYEKCLDFLLQHNFRIKVFQLVSRILTTQVYFDLYLQDTSYQDYLFNYFDSFEKWIVREKFNSQYIKKSYLNFIQISRTLAKHYSSINLKIEKINSLFNSEKNIQAYKWLSSKKDEIIDLKTKRLFKK